jgi:putative nucleotidyltransferase with HDIG domain
MSDTGNMTPLRQYPHHYVGTGSFEVSKAKPLILQACLGTCVGVALYDSRAGVGGLMHLLLPAPLSGSDPFRPEKYASSGLPLFLQAFAAAGGGPAEARATLAGGALVGPVSEMDVSLDIGGRTVERVREILAAERIIVERSETGGFFTCCLNLNLESGQTEILAQETGPEHACQPKPRPLTREQIERSLRRLQPIPQVALKILRITGESDFDIGRIAAEVKQDQVISARTLKLCNSAIFARPARVATLDHALMLLGRDVFVRLIISAAVESFMGQADTGGYSLCKGGLFHHALGTALIAERLAASTGRVPPALAYTAGLLHDIGKVVLDQYLAVDSQGFYRHLVAGGDDLLASEQRVFAIDHTRTGGMLAERWGFPAPLVEAIVCHHRPEGADAQHRDLAAIVYLADLLMSRFGAGLEIERLDTDQLTTRVRELGFAGQGLASLVDLIPDAVLGRHFNA